VWDIRLDEHRAHPRPASSIGFAVPICSNQNFIVTPVT
jgi:hypothetical protein